MIENGGGFWSGIEAMAAVASLILGPATIYWVDRRHRQRVALWDSLTGEVRTLAHGLTIANATLNLVKEKAEHIDECVDQTKAKAVESAALIRTLDVRLGRVENHLMGSRS